MDELDSLEMAKKELRDNGYPVLMGTKYCDGFIKSYGNCDKCEYDFACMELLKLELRYSVEMVLDQLVDDGVKNGEINSNKCTIYRLLNDSCNKCGDPIYTH